MTLAVLHERAEAAAPRRVRILVVDDEPAILRVLTRILREHDLATTTSGSEAVELYRAGGFDVVLCDLMMPRVDGIQVFGEIARLGDEHARRVVFASGGACTPQTVAFLATTANRCLQKPFVAADVRRAIADVLAAAARP